MGDLADIILEMLNDFEDTHGRTPDMNEFCAIRCDSMIIAEANAAEELEHRLKRPGRKIDWIEA